MVEDLRLLIEHLGAQRCVMVAHDWGEAIAWNFAAAHPERLEKLDEDQLIYRLPKPYPDGRTELRFTRLQLIERLPALIPPLRIHRNCDHRVLVLHHVRNDSFSATRLAWSMTGSGRTRPYRRSVPARFAQMTEFDSLLTLGRAGSGH